MYDVAKNLERMVQGIMIRTFSHQVVEQMARYASIPVINGLTDYSHPCQAMADYLTIWEAKHNLEGLKIAFIGDGYNVARSLLFAGAQLGAHVWVATPPGYELDAESVQWARERGAETGGTCTVTNDPEEAAAGADVIMSGRAWGKRRSGNTASHSLSGGCDFVSAGEDGMRSFCIACRRIGAKKSRMMSSIHHGRWCISRRRTGCMRRRRSCWN